MIIRWWKILPQTYVSGNDSYSVDNVSLTDLVNKIQTVLVLEFWSQHLLKSFEITSKGNPIGLSILNQHGNF